MSGLTKMVNRLIKEADVAKFTMHDLRRSLRTIMSRCGYDNEIQRLCVGQKPRGIDQVYNHDEQWIIRKMAFEAAHDYIAELVGSLRRGPPRRHVRANCPKAPSLPDACQTLMISSSISARPLVRRPTRCARVSLGAR